MGTWPQRDAGVSRSNCALGGAAGSSPWHSCIAGLRPSRLVLTSDQHLLFYNDSDSVARVELDLEHGNGIHCVGVDGEVLHGRKFVVPAGTVLDCEGPPTNVDYRVFRIGSGSVAKSEGRIEVDQSPRALTFQRSRGEIQSPNASIPIRLCSRWTARPAEEGLPRAPSEGFEAEALFERALGPRAARGPSRALDRSSPERAAFAEANRGASSVHGNCRPRGPLLRPWAPPARTGPERTESSRITRLIGPCLRGPAGLRSKRRGPRAAFLPCLLPPGRI